MALIVIYPKVEAKILNDCVGLHDKSGTYHAIIDVDRLKKRGKYQGIIEEAQYFYVSKEEIVRLFIKETTPYPYDSRGSDFNLAYSDPECYEKFIKFLFERICTVLEVP